MPTFWDKIFLFFFWQFSSFFSGLKRKKEGRNQVGNESKGGQNGRKGGWEEWVREDV